MNTWHVVSNAEGTILAVYGQALLADSQETARRVARETCCQTFLHHIVGNRPHVGGSISMRGVAK